LSLFVLFKSKRYRDRYLYRLLLNKTNKDKRMSSTASNDYLGVVQSLLLFSYGYYSGWRVSGQG